MTNRRGEMGEPWGVPTATGENFLGEPWNRSRDFRLERKLLTQEMTYLCLLWPLEQQ